MDLLVRLLRASELRAKVITSNIANQNTPGYTRRVVQFEELLKESIDKSDGRMSEVEPRLELDEVSPPRPDGNNVSLEKEINGLRENRLLYETYSAILRGHFNLLQAAITEGR